MPLMGFFENVVFPQFSGRLNYKQNTRKLSFEQRVGKGCWEVSLTKRGIFGCKNMEYG